MGSRSCREVTSMACEEGPQNVPKKTLPIGSLVCPSRFDRAAAFGTRSTKVPWKWCDGNGQWRNAVVPVAPTTTSLGRGRLPWSLGTQ